MIYMKAYKRNNIKTLNYNAKNMQMIFKLQKKYYTKNFLINKNKRYMYGEF
jgi:hypothetical protein